MLEAEPECVKVIDANQQLVDINRAGLDMLEAESPEQLREHGVLSCIAPEYQAQYGEHFQAALAGQASRLQFEIVGLRGTRRYMESNATALDLPDGRGRAMLSVTRDISERVLAQQQLHYLSQYDSLTGLPNRRLYADHMVRALAQAQRHEELVGVLWLNLDRFKQINEALGQVGGDELLRLVGQRMGETLRDSDTVARLDADQFAILAEGVPSEAALAAVAEKLLDAFQRPFHAEGNEVFVTPSIGVASYPAQGDDPEQLLELAEVAMRRVKKDGGAGYQFHKDGPRQDRRQRLGIEMGLRHALERDELALNFQPKVSLRTGQVTGVEALLRWNSAQLGPISPAQFIPIAEETGLILPIGEWVLRNACVQASGWHQMGHRISIAINLSPRQFRQRDLVAMVARVLRETGLPASFLELEITEGTAMSNAEQGIKLLSELHGLGIRLSVDDFGTGYSSLSYLKRFPLDSLKIDRSFVMDLGSDHDSGAIVRATIALAQSLRLKVVAEGVETEAQRGFLAGAGCDEMQGYLFSKPLPAAQLLTLLERAQAANASQLNKTGTD